MPKGTPRASRSPPEAGLRAQPRASKAAPTDPASRLIDHRIRDLGGWRGATLARMRALIRQADREVTEVWKWTNPVWSHHGIVCTGEACQKVVKLTFAHGAEVPDPWRLFNTSLESETRRAIDVREGEEVGGRELEALVKAAVARKGPGDGDGSSS